MTGLDCLKEEMLSRGCTKAQCESKTVAVVLDILSKSGDAYTRQYEMEAELKKIQEECECWDKYYAELMERIKWERQKQENWENETQSYINDLISQIEKCESIEGRDRIKCAQMFVNSVDVSTKYDNTAYIIGLSAILSGGKIAPVDELRKINKKIPTLREF